MSLPSDGLSGEGPWPFLMSSGVNEFVAFNVKGDTLSVKDDKLAVTKNQDFWKRNSKCTACGKMGHGRCDVAMREEKEL